MQIHSSDRSLDAAQSKAASMLGRFLSEDLIAYIPLMQQLLAAEECLQPKP